MAAFPSGSASRGDTPSSRLGYVTRMSRPLVAPHGHLQHDGLRALRPPGARSKRPPGICSTTSSSGHLQHGAPPGHVQHDGLRAPAAQRPQGVVARRAPGTCRMPPPGPCTATASGHVNIGLGTPQPSSRPVKHPAACKTAPGRRICPVGRWLSMASRDPSMARYPVRRRSLGLVRPPSPVLGKRGTPHRHAPSGRFHGL